ncbi:MAG: carboxynorspermidine decarboxylase [Lentisphaerae bacterium]|nr:carboxynorspermidine decarboxylase [Lentisphaerota bacterium]
MNLYADIQTPAFVVDEAQIRRNCERLATVKHRTGCTILLALKGFAMWSLFPVIKDYLDGVCASSPWEAHLGRNEFGGDVHAFAAAYAERDIAELITLCDGIVFNSFAQWERFKPSLQAAERPIRAGLRINPECSTQLHALYDPCAPFSRLGITADHFKGQSLDGITGLHFHTLCEQDADALATTLTAVDERFGEILPQMEWVNFGGGHHITRPDYDVDLLCNLITAFQDRYGVQVILEPGEAVALNAGHLVTRVLDVVHNGMPIAILDCSCTCHMPDVLEMPYRATVSDAGPPHFKPHTYRLAGLSCLAGDVIGDYSFDHPLQPGDQLVFEDMAHYTMVKTTMFNGIQHPSIAIQRGDAIEVVRAFSYSDYKERLS